jgi:hypothetical protein
MLKPYSFFEDIERLFERNYLPTDQDILRTRLRTTGISETLFELGNFTYRMFDVGGQRSERKKWIHVFDNVQVVLFLAAISGYDQALVEDRSGVSCDPLFLPKAYLTCLAEPNERGFGVVRANIKFQLLFKVVLDSLPQQDGSLPRETLIWDESDPQILLRL